jgi:hypothetical protein
MAKFITSKGLKEAIYDVIWNAERQLVIVSPFVKLNDYFKSLFEKHKHNWRVHILLVFGKNESEPKRSLKQDDFEFFKQFKNITIVYCNRLHAKYYANESEGVITSINLYDSSFENNIEFGIHQKVDLLNSFGITSNPDKEAWDYVQNFTKKYPIVFIKRPVLEKGLLSPLTGKKYLESEVLYDSTAEIIKGGRVWESLPKKYIIDYEEEILVSEQISKRISEDDFKAKNELNNEKKLYAIPTKIANSCQTPTAYCIRSKESIPFNISKPYSDSAYKSWNHYRNPSYKETYCHKCGRGWTTSMNSPLCSSCR